MRILFPIGDWVFGKNTNPYVRVLIEGLRGFGHDIDIGVDKFFDKAKNYDLIFFQWPDVLLAYAKVNRIDLIKEVRAVLNGLKSSETKTLITCHNLHPHDNNQVVSSLYNLLYSNVNAIHHLGDFSYNLFKAKYPLIKHFIVPHPMFYDLYKYDKFISRSYLNISMKDTVVLAFGSFRNKEETDLFINMVKGVGTSDITYLAPQIPYGSLYNGRMLNRSIEFVRRWIKYKMLHIRPSGYVDESLIPTYLAASDIVFIQRKDILNSGNVPLAFSAGKLVVGPQVGNVGSILKETGNFVFCPDDIQSVIKAVKNACFSCKNGTDLGDRNYLYANKYLTPQKTINLLNKEIQSI